jgi:hypothetical protein
MNQQGKTGFREKWKQAWAYRSFRNQTLSGALSLIGLFSFLPFFFKLIESRNGIQLDDWLLDIIHPLDVSVAIFLFVWAVTFLMIVRMVQNPQIFVIMLWAYLILTLMRVFTISFIGLNAPKGLLILVDPLSNIFYGPRFITKDLFYSGHTSTAFLMFLCLRNKADKIFTLTATLTIATLLLIQHVHYTIDIVAAPFFALLSYLISKKMIHDFSY